MGRGEQRCARIRHSMPTLHPTEEETDNDVTIAHYPYSFYISRILLTLGAFRDKMLQIDKPRSPRYRAGREEAPAGDGTPPEREPRRYRP